jgi:hypothetical protein
LFGQQADAAQISLSPRQRPAGRNKRDDRHQGKNCPHDHQVHFGSATAHMWVNWRPVTRPTEDGLDTYQTPAKQPTQTRRTMTFRRTGSLFDDVKPVQAASAVFHGP